jgi:hypothetical protein
MDGTFSFAEEFPGFRYLRKVPSEGSPRSGVFDGFLNSVILLKDRKE